MMRLRRIWLVWGFELGCEGMGMMGMIRVGVVSVFQRWRGRGGFWRGSRGGSRTAPTSSVHNYRHSGESRRFSGRNAHPEGPGNGVQSETPSLNPL